MRASSTATRAEARLPARLAVGAVLLGIIAALVRIAATRVSGTPYPLDLDAAIAGAATTVANTLPAALKTWAVLAVTLLALARWLRGAAPSLRPAEAMAGAIVLLWSGTYALLLALGPVGLYRPWILRVVLAAVVVLAVARGRSPSTPTPARRSPGPAIAGLAFGLALVPLLLMQLGSPVSPFMDVLPYVASTQKIVTFHYYDPLANDAAGHWAATRQVAGCDAPFSFLALVTGESAALAITSLIVAAAALQCLGLYLLGRAVHGPVAGGMAVLFLLTTFVWRRTPDVRGTALAFALIAIGLSFLFSRRRDRPVRTGLGGLAFGIAVAVNPLIGAIGMQVASVTLVLAWLDGAWRFWPAVLALAGATVLALPQVSVGLTGALPVWTLAAFVAAGGAIVALAARSARTPPAATRRCAVARLAALAAVVLTIAYRHAHRGTEFFPENWHGYGPLVLLAMPGLAVLGGAVMRAPARWPAAAVPAVAILMGFLDHRLADPLRFQGTLETRSLASEVTTKMIYYWWPYWCALLAGVAFAALARRRAVSPTLALVLALVIYPFDSPKHAIEFDTKQLALAETWGHHLTHAARGYHGGRPDRRWILDDAWREVQRFFMAEIAAGRVRYDTHVLHVSESVHSIELALGTGISVDLVTPQFDPASIWTVGGRIRGMEGLPAALAAAPPYVMVQSMSLPDPTLLAGYDLVLDEPQHRLSVYRLRALTAVGY